ncbi:MAG: hypothetical protein Q9191_007457 [Dirinaria sp. TL-2023a]
MAGRLQIFDPLSLQPSPSLDSPFRFDIAVDSEYSKDCYFGSYSLEDIYNRSIGWAADRFKHPETMEKLRSDLKYAFRLVYTSTYEEDRAEYLDSLLYGNLDFPQSEQRVFRQKFWQLLANVEETVELRDRDAVRKFIVERLWPDYVHLAVIVDLRTEDDKIFRSDFSQKREGKVKNYYLPNDYNRGSGASWFIF